MTPNRTVTAQDRTAKPARKAGRLPENSMAAATASHVAA